MKIAGNTFIVTGGVGGIGAGVVKLLLDENASVGIFDIFPADQVEDKVSALGPRDSIVYHQVNITEEAAVTQAVEKVVEQLGNLKGVVHCAGIALKREWTNDILGSVPNFKKMLDVNVLGTFIIDGAVADAINKPLNHPDGTEKHAPFWTADEERGVIINFASAAARPYARCLAYGPTKTATIGITQAMSDFLGPSGIRVASISPSIVVTGLTANFSTFFTDDLLKHATFPRRPLTPADMAHTVKYIIENPGVNGIDVPVDGGWRLVCSKPGLSGGEDPRYTMPGLE